MIRHIVIFQLRRPVEEAAVAAFAEASRAFGAAAPHTAAPPKVLVDLRLFPDGTYATEVGLEVLFADADAFQAYLDDPVHVAYVEDVLIPSCDTWLSTQVEA